MLALLINSKISRRAVLLGFVIFAFTGLGFLIAPKSQALTVAPRLELEADPGRSVGAVLKVINEERQTKTFYLRSQNFDSQDETGNPSFTTRQEDLAIWIKSPLSITLGPGETINMPIQIDVPYNAEPGGHYAAIFYLTEAPPVTDDASKVALNTKLGTLILLRVHGNFVQNANILEFGTVNKRRFYTQLPVQFFYRFQNIGDDHQKPIGDIQIKNLFGWVSKILIANPTEGSVLPKSVRKFFSSWTEYGGNEKQAAVIDPPKEDKLAYWDAVNFQARHFLMGRYTANLKVAYGSKELKSDHAEFVFYIIPWQFLSIAIPLLIIVLWILRRLIKRYNRYIIRKAQQK